MKLDQEINPTEITPVAPQANSNEQILNLSYDDWFERIKNDPVNGFLNSPDLDQLANLEQGTRLELLANVCASLRVSSHYLQSYFEKFPEDLDKIRNRLPLIIITLQNLNNFPDL